MALFDPPHIGMRNRVAQSPRAIEPYAAFEATVRQQLQAWPQRSADLATGMIMSAWTRKASREGMINIPAARLRHIVNLGKLCGWRMKSAEAAWTQELMGHLMPNELVH
jgi:hypothetical protein